ncbi:MAG: TlpA family protein disulfide reductase [Gammaproteobacteria bacterium]|nr:TlpA family protein disulfide reductase [Gammaproteobacteria bacterium]
MHLRRLLGLFLLLLPLPGTGADETFDYQLRDMDGRLYKVSDYRGKWLIINFWATWCAPCLKEMPELERFYQQNWNTAQVWGVSFEDGDKAAIQAYVDRLGITFPLLGYGQDPLTGYGAVNVLPTTFLIDPNGLFQHRFEGPITANDIAAEIARAR